MGTKSMAKKHDKKSENLHNLKLAIVPIFALLIKLVIIFNVKEIDGSIIGGWLGAAGESYLKGVNGLILDGFYSDEGVLSYWPAGYPILIWILCFITTSHVILLLSVVQSILHAFASYFLVKSIHNSN